MHAPLIFWCMKHVTSKGRDSKKPMFQYWYLVLRMELHLLQNISTMYYLSKKSYHDYFPSVITFMHDGYLYIHVYMTWKPQVNQAFTNDRKNCKPIFLDGFWLLNKLAKGDGGAIDHTEDEDKLRKWMVCGSEVIHYISSGSLKEIQHSDGCRKTTSGIMNRLSYFRNVF